ncbi:hypothetical protein FQA39_LY12872 [Lamprigera yunnana]|nr:hypothetical protein FQA39_LY12872 [Lamprigera yunnana]
MTDADIEKELEVENQESLKQFEVTEELITEKLNELGSQFGIDGEQLRSMIQPEMVKDEIVNELIVNFLFENNDFDFRTETNLEIAIDKFASQLKFISVDTKALLIQENDLVHRAHLISSEQKKQNTTEKVETRINENTNLNSGIDVDRDIQKELKDKMDKQQKEYYLVKRCV